MTNEIWKTDQSHSVYEFLIKFSLTFFLHFFFHFSFTHLKHAAVVSRICSTNTYLFSFFWSQTDTWDIIKRFLNTAKVQSFQGPINSYAQSIKKKKFKKHFLKRFKKKNFVTLVVFYIAGYNLLQPVLTHFLRPSVILVWL